MRLALKVVAQNTWDFGYVILLYCVSPSYLTTFLQLSMSNIVYEYAKIIDNKELKYGDY